MSLNTNGRPQPAMKLLVVESGQPERDDLKSGLCRDGFQVEACADAQAARQLLEGPDRFELVVLDARVGIVLLDEARVRGDATPFIIVTGSDGLEERLRVLHAGADDCIARPFSIDELRARVKMVLRRTARRAHPTFSCADLTLDPVRRSVHRRGVEIHLTTREFSLLQALLESRGAALSRTRILEDVWAQSLAAVSNVVEVHIRHLRAKVDKPFGRPLIHTVRGVGYLLAARD